MPASKAAPTSAVASANDGTRPVSVLTSTTYWLSGALALVASIAGEKPRVTSRERWRCAITWMGGARSVRSASMCFIGTGARDARAIVASAVVSAVALFVAA